MHNADEEELSLGGSCESFVNGKESSIVDVVGVSSKRPFTDGDQKVKRSYNNLNVDSAQIVSQMSSPISFFAKAESTRSNAMQEAGANHAEVSIAVNLSNGKVNVSNMLGQHTNRKLNLFRNAAEIMPVVFNPAMHFRDGSIPITYKENNLVNLKIIKMRESFLTPVLGSLILEDGYLHHTDYEGLMLVACPDNKWAIKNEATGELLPPEAGKSYAFVTMPDKSIRIAEAEKKAHCNNSGVSPIVRYAGNVSFDEQSEIIEWDNSSGSYKPPANLAHQAGFGEANMSKFIQHSISMDIRAAAVAITPMSNMVAR